MKNKILVFLLITFLTGITIQSYSQGGVFEAPPDDLHPVQDRKDQKPVPYQYLREANVMWQKRIWRTIDMREKMNEVFYYPKKPANGRISFMSMIMKAINEENLIVYQYDAFNDDFSQLLPLPLEQMKAELSKTDSVKQQRPYPPYDFYDTIIKKEFDASEVMVLRLKEDWFVDRERSLMDVRIIGICPILEQYDAQGELKGTKPLFWIYFNDASATPTSARVLFARNTVFNRFNAAERRSYDDIFFKRMFNSYIYKEENVFDRKISQYISKGLDQLLESDRIRNDMFKYEHDLWEY